MRNSYTIEEFFSNVISLVYTKVFYKGARLIRRPIYIRGKRFFQYGDGFTTGYSCRIEMFDLNKEQIEKKLIIGSNCKIGDYVHIAASERVVIGDNCLMASKIYISDTNHGDYSSGLGESSPDMPPDKRALYTKPVNIGDNVWIGENVCILPGATVGDGSIIGANSVVNSNIPNNCIAVGAPAKVIKIYDYDAKVWRKIDQL